MRFLVSCVGIVLLLSACADRPRSAPRPQNDPAAPPETPARGYTLEEEGTAPPTDVEFEEDVLDPPEAVASEAFGSRPVESDALEPIPAEVEAPVSGNVQTPVPPQPPAEGQRGFRVQIAALAGRGEADTMAREAATRTGVPAYVVFESNLFKVHVGDFLERGAALGMRDRCRQVGYSGAWVVTTQVKLRPGR